MQYNTIAEPTLMRISNQEKPKFRHLQVSSLKKKKKKREKCYMSAV